MKFGNFIIAGNHSTGPEDIPPKTLEAIKKTNYIFCDHLFVFQEEIVDFYNIDISNKIIIETGFVSNESDFADKAFSIVSTGEDVLFISDTGLPGFADKGLGIINMAHEKNVNVQIIPGPSITGMAIAIAGINSHRCEENYSMSLFDYPKENKIKKFNKVKDFESIIVVLCHPEEVFENIEIAEQEFSPERLAAICIDIGTESQKIVRGAISQIKQHAKDLKNCATCLVFEGSFGK